MCIQLCSRYVANITHRTCTRTHTHTHTHTNTHTLPYPVLVSEWEETHHLCWLHDLHSIKCHTHKITAKLADWVTAILFYCTLYWVVAITWHSAVTFTTQPKLLLNFVFFNFFFISQSSSPTPWTVSTKGCDESSSRRWRIKCKPHGDADSRVYRRRIR